MVLKIRESQVDRVNALVRNQCCNYDDGDCLLLDDGEAHPCIQLLAVTGIYCRYFRQAVLPAEKRLYAEILQDNESEIERTGQYENN